MMISPDAYITDRLENAPYPELIREREKLIRLIRNYEKKEAAGDRSDPAWKRMPTPEVQYQLHLQYLGALCNLMRERYNSEYVWESRTLRDDVNSSDQKQTN